jgi:hypothetical protein
MLQIVLIQILIHQIGVLGIHVLQVAVLQPRIVVSVVPKLGIIQAKVKKGSQIDSSRGPCTFKQVSENGYSTDHSDRLKEVVILSVTGSA